MVHLVDATPQLARVVGPVRLPVAALVAPLGLAIALAHKHVMAVEWLEARAHISEFFIVVVVVVVIIGIVNVIADIIVVVAIIAVITATTTALLQQWQRDKASMIPDRDECSHICGQ